MDETTPTTDAPGQMTMPFDPTHGGSYRAILCRIEGRPRWRNLWSYLRYAWGMDIFFGPVPVLKTWAAINVALSVLIGVLT